MFKAIPVYYNRIAIVEKPIFYGSGNSTLTALNQFNGSNDMRFSVVVDKPGNKFSYRLFPNSGYIESNLSMNSEFLGTKKGNWLKDKLNGNRVAFIMFGSGISYTPGDSWRVNCRSKSGKNTFGGATDFTLATTWDGGFAKVPMYKNSAGALIDLSINPGALIKIDISESQGAADQPEQIFVSSGSYQNIEEWFYEDQVYSSFKQYSEDGKNHGPQNVFFRRLENNATGQTQSQDGISGGVQMIVKGYDIYGPTGLTSPNPPKNKTTVLFNVLQQDNPTILETLQ